MLRTLSALLLMLGLTATQSFGALKAKDVYPTEHDPFVGDYVGRWGPEEEVAPNIAAQIIALGKGKYRVLVVNKLDMRCPPRVDVELEPSKGKLSFKDGSYFGETDGTTFTGGRAKVKFSMTKQERLSPTLNSPPPDGTVVLFDGSGLDAWDGTEGWEVTDDGALMVTPEGKYLISKGAWLDVRMHIEFRLPFMPRARGQARGNSGVFLQDLYEVQILDSYGIEGYYNECGALYKLSAPHVNACSPPLQWQTYDITYTAPRYDGSGTLLSNGYITVYHNGVLIHYDQELKYITAWKEKERLAPPPSAPGHIRLQGHNNFVQFRNIWLENLSAKD